MKRLDGSATPTADSTPPFLVFLQERLARGGFTTDDALASALPLFREVLEAHDAGKVAPLEGLAALKVEDHRLWFEDIRRESKRINLSEIKKIDRNRSFALNIVGESERTLDLDEARGEVKNKRIGKAGESFEYPLYLPGYRSWEHELNHQDELTDLFVLGLILASLACELDLTEPEDLERFVEHRENLFALKPTLHPVVAKAIVRMTELSRHDRAQDLREIIEGLEHYRRIEVAEVFDPSKISGLEEASLKGKRELVLEHLQRKLFEISRRNRLLYFKPTLQSLNMTWTSVPVMFDHGAIKPEDLFTWHPKVARLFCRQGKKDPKPFSLNEYLCIDQAPYAPGVLDKMISDVRKDRAEYGFSQLRVVLCFLRWHNLKERKEERIHSPLLLLPVKLSKKKGIRDTYYLEATEEKAEVNPVLRYQLRQLYDIQLPESIELAPGCMDDFYKQLEKRIAASGPGVSLNKIDKPRIELIHERAKRRLNAYRRRVRLSGKGVRSYGKLDYSYQPGNFQPLGLRLFEACVKIPAAPLGLGAGRGKPGSASGQHFAEPVGGVTKGVSAAGAVTEHSQRVVAFQEGSGNNPYSWDFDLCSITLGNFRYRKMTLVKDYEELLETGLENPAYDALFSLDPTRHQTPEIPPLPLNDRFPVVACDATQSSSIALARTGRSYIIQGPPGTGKSQTITNLIADFAAQGKRVLFVCQKRAALDVVYHRLHQHDLQDLCCLIHDSQADKKPFIQELKRTYELWLSGQESEAQRQPEKERAAALEALEREKKALEEFNASMRSHAPSAGVPFRALLLRLVELKNKLPRLDPAELERMPFYEAWKSHEEPMTRFDKSLRELAPEGVFKRHPLHRLGIEVCLAERPIHFVEEHLGASEEQLAKLEKALSETGQPESVWASVGKAREIAEYAVSMRPLAEKGLIGLLDEHSVSARDFNKHASKRKRLEEALQEALRKTDQWNEKIPERDLEAVMRQAQSLEGNFLRFLFPSFWRMRNLLRCRYNFFNHVVKPSWSQILKELADEYQAADAVKEHETEVREAYGIEEEDTLGWITTTVSDLSQKTKSLPDSAEELHRELVRNPEAGSILSRLYPLHEQLEKLHQTLDAFLDGALRLSFSRLKEMLESIKDHRDALSDFLPCLAELREVPPEMGDVLREMEVTVTELEAAMAERTLQAAYRNDRPLLKFDDARRERHIERLKEAYKRWESLNSDCVVGRVRKKFLQRHQMAALPNSQLNDEQKAFKKKYTAGRRILEHEFGKVMRYKSIRDMVALESGEVVMDLKPVWLMSPLSVSDALPLKSDCFDVVIYDEASQIPLEEAVPPLFRGAQIIVVGDQMQMPPTSFFASKQSEEETLLVEEEGEIVELDLEAHGFLTYATRTLPATLLGWHYRSRSESLISFSNAAFYQRKLYTIPDRRVPHPDRGAIEVEQPLDGEVNAERLLSRAVSFHYQQNARYQKRRNTGEADYVARLVKGLLDSGQGLSMGIVAFSEAQQDEIETALERLGQQDEDFRNRLEEEFEREEDDQFVGLIIKNLENIQGDERDIIILSVCYGHGADGKMLMNFGPINQRGGEKRLNVAFSRAKRHMAVVSSIHYSDITNIYNDGANCLRQYLEYTEALSKGDYPTSNRVLSSLSPLGEIEDGEIRDAVVLQLGEALRKHGYRVDLNVGDSRFRVDLGVRKKSVRTEDGPADYLACVLVDTDAHYQQTDLLERDVQRPSVLTAFGWKVCHVLTKDWYHKPEEVLKKLLKVIEA